MASDGQLTGSVWPVNTLGLGHSFFCLFVLTVLTFRNWKSYPCFWISFFFFYQKIWQLWAYTLIWSYLAGVSNSGCPQWHAIPTWPWTLIMASVQTLICSLGWSQGPDQNHQRFSLWLEMPVT